MHVCPIHKTRVVCQAVTHCSLPYVSVCFGDHSWELLQAYVAESRQKFNEELREAERECRAAYSEGRWDERQEKES